MSKTKTVKKVKEVVVNIVNFSIVEPVSLASTEYDSDVDEFKKFQVWCAASTHDTEEEICAQTHKKLKTK